MKKMNKIEFYNSIIEVTRETGQGVPDFIGKMMGQKIVDELVAEGKIKIVRQRFTTLPDNVFLCLNGIYCVEEDQVGHNLTSLYFLRKYLCKAPDKFGSHVIDYDDFAQKNQQDYDVWLNKNQAGLEALKNLKTTEEENVNVSLDSIKRYWMERNIFTDTMTVSECLMKIKERYENNQELLSHNQELKKLYTETIETGSSVYKDDLKKCKSDIIKYQEQIAIIKEMINLLYKANADENAKQVLGV
jgi:hypothetical protein